MTDQVTFKHNLMLARTIKGWTKLNNLYVIASLRINC